MSRHNKVKWAILGVGIAGRARGRAIAADQRASLVATWRGRHQGDLDAPQAGSCAEAIAAAECVAVCSPTEVHADQVRAVLQADRHALVEYPVASDPRTAADLFALARARQRILHVAHIELLDAAGTTMRALVHPELVERVEVLFEAPGPEDAAARAIALRNVARLHRVVAVAGPVASVDEIQAVPGRLEAHLSLASGADVQVSFQQAPYFGRRTVLRVSTAVALWQQTNTSLTRDGVPQTLLGVGSLFGVDQRAASARLLDGGAPYVSEDRILHVLDVVEALGEGRLGPVPTRG